MITICTNQNTLKENLSTANPIHSSLTLSLSLIFLDKWWRRRTEGISGGAGLWRGRKWRRRRRGAEGGDLQWRRLAEGSDGGGAVAQPEEVQLALSAEVSHEEAAVRGRCSRGDRVASAGERRHARRHRRLVAVAPPG